MTRTHAHERTCNLASVELETEGDAILPGLWSDPNEPGQDRLRDAVENHLGRICVSVENLESKGKVGYYQEEMCCNLAVLSYFSFSVRHTHTLV